MNNITDTLLKKGSLADLNLRPARALIGWMSEREALIALAIPDVLAKPLPQHLQQVKMAHTAAAARSAVVNQTHVLTEPPDNLGDYLAEVRSHPSYQQYFNEGGQIKMAALSQLHALQPIVHLDYFTVPATVSDNAAIAKITLPLASSEPVAMEYDPQRNAWVIETHHLNTRVVGNFNCRAEITPGFFGTAYGFCVAQLLSVVQVVKYRERYFLKDGYHRSVALLAQGITHIPVIYKEISASEPLSVEGRFPDDILLGEHPPCLADYLRDDVAAKISHLVSKKTIMIQQSETQEWGY